jgi:serine/threonine-protein kinase RsbW
MAGMTSAASRTIDAGRSSRRAEDHRLPPTAEVSGAAPAHTAAEVSGAAPVATAGTGFRDEVTVRLPADGAYLSVLRTATAGLAARLDFTLDEIEDLRIAVDEACAMLLNQAVPGGGLECRFRLGQDTMTISVSVRSAAPTAPASDSFAWTVLCALAGSVNAEVGPGQLLTITLRKSRGSLRSATGGS